MEIKTCEQYVLERLERAEIDVESLKNILEIKDSHIAELTEELNNLKALIRRHLEITFSVGAESDYVTFETIGVYEHENPIDFHMFADIIEEGK